MATKNDHLKDELLDLARKCHLDVEKVIQRAKIGGKPRRNNSLLKEAVGQNFIEVDEKGHIPFEFSIEVFGIKKQYKATFNYDATFQFINQNGQLEECGMDATSSIKVLGIEGEQALWETPENPILICKDFLFYKEPPRAKFYDDPTISELFPRIFDDKLINLINEQAMSHASERI